MQTTKSHITKAWQSLKPHLLSAWGLRGLAVVVGLATALAHPPFGFILGLFGYGLFVFVIEQVSGAKPLRQAFFLGWIAGFFYFLIGCFWVAEAFLVDAAIYGWMAPFAVCLLPLIMGLYWGATAFIYRWLNLKSQWRGLYFAIVFSSFEIWRGILFTGFAWNPAGASWVAGSPMSQLASLIGVYGLSTLTMAIFTTPVVVHIKQGWRGYAPIVVAVFVLLAGYGYGAYRLSATPIEKGPTLIRLVQPAIGQKAKWTRGAFDKVFTDYVRMSIEPTKIAKKPHPDIIIWPEGALPASADELFSNQSWTSQAFARLLLDKQTLIFGAYRSDFDEKDQQVWRNSLFVLQQRGDKTHIDATYNKFKLVPFGEFLPAEKIMAWLGIKSLVHFGEGFTKGARTKSIKSVGVPRFLPLICYEGLFPSLDQTRYVSDQDPNRPKFIVNISNDAWFGPTSGPVQHLNLSSYRAIEEGIAIVRSTPTGISAVVDPLGRPIVSSRLESGQRGYTDTFVPKEVTLTLYSQSRLVFTALTFIFFLILMANRSFVLRNKK